MSKRYNRLRNVLLPEFPIRKHDLRDLLIKRSSYRKFSGKPIKLQQLSEILYYSAGLVGESEGKFHFPYPSAGGKYPIEIYPLVLYGKDELKIGLYHYSPTEHALDILLTPLKKEDISSIWMSQKWFRKASVILILTAVYHRTTDKYGQKGLPFPFIEAGHIGQNIYLLAQSLGIGCCAIGQFKEKQLCELLDINPFEEYPIYYMALGN